MTKDNWIKALLKIFNEEKNGLCSFDVDCPLCDKRYKRIFKIVEKVEKDAIEKTNKRWRGKFDDIKADGVTRLECGCEVMKVTLCDKHAGFIPLSDLLEDKK